MGCDCCGPPKIASEVAAEAIPELPALSDNPQSVIASFNDNQSPGDAPETTPPSDDCTKSTTPVVQDCCASENDAPDRAEPMAEKKVEVTGAIACITDACCTKNKPEVANEKNNDPLPKNAPTSCCDSDCDSSPPMIDANATPPCCENKPSPCCDTSCLDRLALRECQTKGASNKTTGSCHTITSPTLFAHTATDLNRSSKLPVQHQVLRYN